MPGSALSAGDRAGDAAADFSEAAVQEWRPWTKDIIIIPSYNERNMRSDSAGSPESLRQRVQQV